MKKEEMISLKECCIHYEVEQSFIHSLGDAGLIEIISTTETICIPEQQLPLLEKLIWLKEMDINLEGIETIAHLLDQINNLQQELILLKNKLAIYES